MAEREAAREAGAVVGSSATEQREQRARKPVPVLSGDDRAALLLIAVSALAALVVLLVEVLG